LDGEGNRREFRLALTTRTTAENDDDEKDWENDAKQMLVPGYYRPVLRDKNHSSLPIPHTGNSALIVPNASNRLVVGQNTSFFCLLYLYRRDSPFATPLITAATMCIKISGVLDP
jgi:hypothetical protein